MHDIIIIGAGPAGLTAAIYAARKKLKTLVLSKDVGGQTIWSFGVENYPGFRMISGVELVQKFEEQIEGLEVELRTNEEVLGIEQKRGYFEVLAKDGKYHGKAVIIASGKVPRKLNVPGEDEFLGKGVAYCATCDAPLFSGKDVAVVGGGNSALETALQLSRIGKQIYVVNKGQKPSGDELIQERVKSAENVEVLNNSQTVKITGGKFVTGLLVKTNGKERRLGVQGVFVEIGFIPSSSFARGLVRTNGQGEIEVNCRNETGLPGIFAAGDVTDSPAKQIIAAAGDGCKAALSAYGYLMKKK